MTVVIYNIDGSRLDIDGVVEVHCSKSFLRVEDSSGGLVVFPMTRVDHWQEIA